MAAERIRANAWTGEAPDVPVIGAFSDDTLSWGLGEAGRQVRKDLKPSVPDKADWRDRRIGWGVVLPAGEDPHPEIQQLIDQRSAEAGWPVPIFRYHGAAAQNLSFQFLQRGDSSLNIVGSGTGVADHEIPSYLLIAASPEKIPWQLQYILSAQRLVGRLDPAMPGIENYVAALTGGFAGAGSDLTKSVVWAVVHADPEDITSTLLAMVARKVHDQLLTDDQLKQGARLIDGSQHPATAQSLIDALVTDKPALVVTSSHGKTGPLDDAPAMLASLGLPVDQGFKTLSPDALTAAWEPNGAIWLAHACCSAGSAKQSGFAGLFKAGDPIDRMLQGCAALGDKIAPLPQKLLGHAKPLRAFVGQVEPTFDWTLKHPMTGQSLTAALCQSIYPRLYHPEPIGLALDPWHDQVDGYNQTWIHLVEEFNAGKEVDKELLAPRLAARDVESTVILGDPTAMLPALPDADN